MIHKFPGLNEMQAIAKQWNIDDFNFILDLEVNTFFVVSYLFLTFRTGFVVITWLNKNLHNDDMWRVHLQLSLTIAISFINI